MGTKTIMVLTVVASLLLSATAGVDAAAEKRVLDCTVESKTLADCDPNQYAWRAVVFAFPGIVVCGILAFLCPTYCVCKYCCNCCGGRNQTPNFCCVDEKYPARYSKGDISRPKVLAVFFFLVGGGSLWWGYSGGLTLTQAVIGFETELLGVPDLLQGKIDLLGAELVIPLYDPTLDVVSEFNIFKDSAVGAAAADVKATVKKNIVSVLGGAKDLVNQMTLVLFICFVAPVCVMLIGVICAICAIRKFLPMLMLWLMFFAGFGMWGAHAAFSAAAFVVADICAEVNGITNQATNLVPVMTDCKDATFTGFRADFKALETQQARLACSAMEVMCYNSSMSAADNFAAAQVYVCPPALSCPAMTYAGLVLTVRNYMFMHENITNLATAVANGGVCETTLNCTIAACSDECRSNSTVNASTGGSSLTVIGRMSKTFHLYMKATNIVSTVIDTLAAQYSNCDAILAILISPMDPPCAVMNGGLITARQASGLEGLAAIAYLFILGWGAKRFMASKEAMEPQEDGVRRLGEDGEKEEG
jgi:hypothetical protein